MPPWHRPPYDRPAFSRSTTDRDRHAAGCPGHVAPMPTLEPAKDMLGRVARPHQPGRRDWLPAAKELTEHMHSLRFQAAHWRHGALDANRNFAGGHFFLAS